ncbi:hypothetical protein A2713_01545 [candidate division WWE3 bacterium RIFCSPHIGHO2_01_FULL_35_17]|uniref:Type II secretion system protein GspG C-terminal domain-containing protein n=1 Tax=candidate division WWE3 bacterium RIFCSPHIGHO2_01_FULL_35_17 TaxID=1802614 RepID=A0A1F4UQ14_UNCKA|nr:MAG: hypothetical protein A2713_01545 [candidate division WWE3 bacterium RIFCSPHIGHO2_01_FULL_35_17]
MNTFPVRFGRKGFTLIELLIVIVIIGILAGVVLVAINPAKQQQRASESVLRTNVEKGCLALNACGVTTSDATKCDDAAAEIGYLTPTAPTGANYYVNGADATALAAIAGDAPATNAASAVRLVGVLGTCKFYCSMAPSTTTAVNIAIVPTATCLID